MTGPRGRADSALVVTGGHSHPPEMSLPVLQELLTDAGLEPVVTQDPEAALAGVSTTRPDLLVVNALRWTMDHSRYADHRDRWALSLSPTARRAVSDAATDGMPVLALHTALVCFDDWPGWGDLIGGSWDWARSHHPPIGAVDVRGADDHPITAGLGAFTVTDECYRDLDLRRGNQVLATASIEGADPHPVAWVREVDGTRVATSALGHDLRSLEHPAHRALLARSVAWLLDGTDPPMREDART